MLCHVPLQLSPPLHPLSSAHFLSPISYPPSYLFSPFPSEVSPFYLFFSPSVLFILPGLSAFNFVVPKALSLLVSVPIPWLLFVTSTEPSPSQLCPFLFSLG